MEAWGTGLALDTRSLLIALMITLSVSAFSFGVALRASSKTEPDRIWLIAHAQLAACLAANLLPWTFPPSLALLALQLSVLCFVAMIISAATIVLALQREQRTVRIVAWISALVLGLGWAFEIPFTFRAALLSGAISMLLGIGAWVLLRGSQHPAPAQRALGILAGFGSVVFFLRTGWSLAGAVPSTLASSGTQTLTILVGIALIQASGVLSALFMRERVLLRLEDEASHDTLTHVFNRRAFEPLAVGAISRLQRVNRYVGLLMIDIDHFKRINDEHGHAAGDQVLTAVVECVGATLRASDVVARWGGEEFAVLLADASDANEADHVAQRLCDAVARLECQIGNKTLHCTISVGVAVTRAPIDFETLLAAADQALYLAKASGRNCVRSTGL